ncbi:MAG: 50S ribosomal protein L20 [bacterium]
MARVKGGVTKKRRHKKFLKLAKGFYGRKKNTIKRATEQVMKGMKAAYIGRKQKKRDFRRLWIARINAACRMNGITYSRFMDGMNKAGIDLNRKQLSELAISDPAAFLKLVETAKAKVLVATN